MVSLNLAKKISISGLERKLVGVVDDPGESLSLRLKVEGSARVWGLVKATGKTTFELSMAHLMSHLYKLSYSAEFAAALGVDIGVASGSVSAGKKLGGGIFFSKPRDVASWIIDQLLRIETLYGDSLQISDADRAEVASRRGNWAFKSRSSEEFVGAEASASVPTFGNERLKSFAPSASVSAKRDWTNMSYESKSGATYSVPKTGTTVKLGGTFSYWWGNLKMKPLFKKGSYTFSYQRREENTRFSPIDHNGNFRFHEISLQFPIVEFARKVNQKQFNRAMTQISKGIGSTVPKWKGFDSRCLKKLYEKAKSDTNLRLTSKTTLVFAWSEFEEGDGEWSRIYDRWIIREDLSASAGQKAGTGMSFELGIAGEKIISEDVKANTPVYIRLAGLYRSEDRWKMFKQEQEAGIFSFVERSADPRFKYYVPEVESAFEPDGARDYEAGLSALRQHWKKSDALRKKVLKSTNEIAKYVTKSDSFWTPRWSKRAYMVMVIDKLEEIQKEDPAAAGELLQRISQQGVSQKELWQNADKTGLSEKLAKIARSSYKAGNINHSNSGPYQRRWGLSVEPVIHTSTRSLVTAFPIKPEIPEMARDGMYVAPRVLEPVPWILSQGCKESSADAMPTLSRSTLRE